MREERGTTSADGRAFLIGWPKRLLHARVALHVALHFAGQVLRGEMSLAIYPRFLRRALLFLNAVRHNKVVRRGGLFKLQLYMPAYPSRAFFHALGKLHRPQPGPVSVVLSMTRACTYRCPHCYQKRDRGADLELPLLIRTAREMQELGVSFFNIEGGEPLLRPDRLMELMGAIDERGEIWINTTGAGLSPALADRVCRAGLAGVMVSIHSPDAAEHDAFTGVPGSFETACRALRTFGERGIFTAINCCASPELVLGEGHGLTRLFDLARDLACDFVQVIHGKAAGGWLGQSTEGGDPAATLARLRELHLAYNTRAALRAHPSIAAQVFDESEDLFGCTAGGVERFYVGADGEVQPCEFLNVSFGNVGQESFATIFARMRSYFKQPGTDWLCCTQAESIAAAIRARGLERTPVPWEVTRELIGLWGKGGETPLYKKLGIYR
ncbi:MAG: radical SAM protein [Candidatus Eisenbacteria bacterium]